MKKITKDDLLGTSTLEEAVKLLFGVKVKGRQKVLPEEMFSPEVGAAYDFMGRCFRSGTYESIAEDIVVRFLGGSEKDVEEREKYQQRKKKDYTKRVPPPRILEVGCGSGLLSIALAEQLEDADIVGMDISPVMVGMAKINYALAFHGDSSKRKSMEVNVQFTEENIHQLPFYIDHCASFGIREDYTHVDYIICRNVLHRLDDPALAVQKMYDSLSVGGKIYLRDLRRDTHWGDLKLRIVGGYRVGDGNVADEDQEKMWFPELLKDKIGAMANMFTRQELTELLESGGIKRYTLSDGKHLKPWPFQANDHTPEYAKEVEFVCVIEK